MKPTDAKDVTVQLITRAGLPAREVNVRDALQTLFARIDELELKLAQVTATNPGTKEP